VAREWPLTGREREQREIEEALAGGQRCVAILGDGGGGRTRLATAVLDRLAGRGYRTIRVNATQAARSVPLGALAPALPPLGPDDVHPLVVARDALIGPDAAPVAILVDDAHLLDDASATIVLQLVLSGLATVLVTVHRWRESPDAVAALWKDGHALRVVLEPLDRDQVGAMVAARLGGPVDDRAVDELMRLAEGLPMALVELVEGSLETGALVERGGTWVLEGTASPSTLLVELVQRRMSVLDDPGRLGLELLVLGEPIPVDAFERLVGTETAQQLEWRSFAAFREDGGRPEVWLGHPLHGEVVRPRLGRLRQRRLYQLLADALDATPGKLPSDLARIAVWRLDTGTPAEPAGLVAAARQAFLANDLAQVQRLATAALDQGPDHEASYLLGCTLLRQGDPVAASVALTDAERLAAEPTWRAEVAGALAEAWFRQGRVDDAVATCLAAEAQAPDAIARLRLAALRAFYLLAGGDAQESLAAMGPIPDDLDPVALAAAGLGAVPALMALGRTGDALALARRVVAVHDTQWGTGPLVLEPATSRAMLGDALRLAGRLDEAEELFAGLYDRLLARRLRPLAGAVATSIGSVALDRGKVEEAATWFERSAELLRGTDAPGREVMALSGLALARASAGDRAGAEASVRAVARRPLVGSWSTVSVEAQATLAVAEGRRDEAVELLVEGARSCAGGHHVVGAIRCLHLLALVGEAETAAELLDELAGELAGWQGPVIEAWIERIRAGADGDADRLALLVPRFEERGFLLLAAEAAAQAAAQHRKRGDARRGQVLADQAAALAARCPDARPPWLVLDVRAVDPLTRREREIAVLAADGRTSREIADRLALSARTVENHLARVYAKLGITGRADLAAALGRS